MGKECFHTYRPRIDRLVIKLSHNFQLKTDIVHLVNLFCAYKRKTISAANNVTFNSKQTRLYVVHRQWLSFMAPCYAFVYRSVDALECKEDQFFSLTVIRWLNEHYMGQRGVG